MATEERTNQALVSALVASNSQPSVPGNQTLVSFLSASCPQPSLTALVVRPSAPNAATTAGVPVNPPTQATICTVAQTFPATNVKLQSIEGSCVVSSLVPNAHISEVILTIASDMEASFDNPRTELDSHANMVVLGLNSFVFESTGKTCNVQPFSTELGIARDVPIVDGALAYDCSYSGIVYVLVVRNALHVPSMVHNLILPFIMRAGGVVVIDVPKVQCKDPAVDDHCVSFVDSNLRIPL